MRNPGNLPALALIFLVFVAVFAGLTYGNYNYAQTSPGGNDFLVHWVGTRALIFDALNPYSDEVAVRIQTIAYGRPANPGEHELRVAYPLYSVVVFTPFAVVSDFTLARALWMSTLEIGLLLMTFLSLRLFKWKLGPILLALLILFSLFWYHGLRPLINGNAVILVALLLTAALLAMRSGADELAGVLFAFSTIKPQVVLLVLIFVVWWALNQRRWRLLGWLVATVLLLAASAALFIPDWPVWMLREVIRYPSYNPPGTPRAAFMEWWPAWGSRVGWALTAVMALLLLAEWFFNRRAEFRGFLWTFFLTLTISQWIGIQTDPGNFVVLFPALILVFSLLDDRWRSGGKWFVGVNLLLLFVGLWFIFLRTIIRADQPIQSPLMFFPLPAYLFVLLYWVRWWAVQPPSVFFDTFQHT